MTAVPARWSTDQLITGIETLPWVRLLEANRFRVDPVYAHRVAWVGALSLGATLMARLDDLRFGAAVAEQPIDPAPIFVLGHWRSGTTHLHNLLGRVPAHTYPTVFQCVFPSSFLTGESVVPPLTNAFMDDTRSYDNVRHGWNEAAEDEIALSKLTGLSPYLAFMFPERAAAYERFVDFHDASEAERTAFLDGLEGFVRKIMWQTGGKRVVVKSCTHSARIPLILERFPDARFVVIHRDPYEVYASTMHMRSHTDWENFFHLPDDVEGLRREQTLALGHRIFSRLAEDRSLIRSDRLVELRYDALCGHEMTTMASLWDRLDLPDWEEARQPLQAYVDGLQGYTRNALRLPDADRVAVADRWGVAFDAFGYER